MTPEKLKFGLENYSRPTINPSLVCLVYADKHGHQSYLSWTQVAECALDYIEKLEEIVAVAKSDTQIKHFIQTCVDRDAALREVERLRIPFAENAMLTNALHQISLCSQNSLSSMTECGKIARETILKSGK